MAVSLKNSTDAVLDRYKQAHWQCFLLDQWNTLVGSLYTRMRLESINEDTLIIGVYESHWMQELFLLSRVIISTVNKALGEPKIKHVRLKLVERKKAPQVYEPIKAQPPIKKELLLTAAEQQALKKVDDTELQKVLILFLGRVKGE